MSGTNHTLRGVGKSDRASLFLGQRAIRNKPYLVAVTDTEQGAKIRGTYVKWAQGEKKRLLDEIERKKSEVGQKEDEVERAKSECG